MGLGNDIDEVRESARDLYTSYEAVDLWIKAPNKMLGDKTPLEMVENGNKEEVLNLLQGIKDGAYF